jgi:hypothetical protein
MNKPDLIRKIHTLEALTNTEKADFVWKDKPKDLEQEFGDIVPT